MVDCFADPFRLQVEAARLHVVSLDTLVSVRSRFSSYEDEGYGLVSLMVYQLVVVGRKGLRLFDGLALGGF